MNSVKLISNILYYFSKFLGIIYSIIAVYITFSILTKWSFIERDGGKYFSICFPFTDIRFLNGENTWAYMLFSFIIPIAFYGLFFLLISRIFKIFTKEKLFTQQGVDDLTIFYRINVTLPWVTLCLAYFFCNGIEEGLDMLAVIHFLLGIFTLFLAYIFSKGVKLQSDQDLII